MANDATRWTLADVVDFEQATAAAQPSTMASKTAALTASRGREATAARRAGLRAWLVETGPHSAGKRFGTALAVVGSGLAFVMFLAGVSAVLGLFDISRGGINVTLFLAILLGGQWLVLIVATCAWLLRRRAAEGFSGVQALLGKLVRRLAGNADNAWWQRLMDQGGEPRNALLWRLARMVQAAGMFFNVGILTGLGGLVLLRHVSFFWETTTQAATYELLEKLTHFLSLPWAAWWPTAVPGPGALHASMWEPGRNLPTGPEAWWEFLLMATLFWGLVPRALLWLLAWKAEKAALGRLDFQSRAHRALWRDLTATGRVETDEPPLDGVLVLDVGGSGLTAESLRPFMLRHLRVHPAAWLTVAVLDAAAEDEATRAIKNAPAGVVLLAEGWSLSPPRMVALHSKIRAAAGPDAPVKFLVANVGPDLQPSPPTDEERSIWIRFVDSLRDPAAEVFFVSEPPQDGL